MKDFLRAGIMIAVILAVVCVTRPAFAKEAKEIDASVDVAMERFTREVPNAANLLAKAKGVLVFPDLMKGGFGIGGEYGEGALRINGKSVAYYNSIGGSFGFQLGGQTRRVYYLFMEDAPLKEFRNSSGWKGGMNASAVFVDAGAEGFIDGLKLNEPVLAFVFAQKGLMFNLNLEVSKFNELKK